MNKNVHKNIYTVNEMLRFPLQPFSPIWGCIAFTSIFYPVVFIIL